MTTTFFVLAATLTRFLDPYTVVYQSDESNSDMKVSIPVRTDYWPMPNGLKDPLSTTFEPRIIHTHYYVFNDVQAGYDENEPSALFKVNQVGYLPWAPKFAYLGGWLGPHLGPWKPRTPLTSWQLVDAITGNVVLDSPSAPSVRVKDIRSKDGTPFTGEETYEMDFSSVTNEGTYFVRVPGVGRSMTFRISQAAAEDAFRVHMGGLYQKRCGIAKAEPWTHWVAGACHELAVRGLFPPDEGTLEPKTRMFDIIRWNTDWEGGEWVEVSGGWHDAADYDRRPMHLNIVNDLCAVYLMKKENFRDGQLLIPENENQIPDILDEAEWGLRHLLAVQEEDGGVGTWIESVGHPGPGNVAANDPMKYAISRATRRSSLMFAAHAALLARCNSEFRDRYLEPAKNAWIFAMSNRPHEDIFEVRHKKYKLFTETEVVTWEESEELPIEYLVKAAVNLHALTGDHSYFLPFRNEKKHLLETAMKSVWAWPPLLFEGERTFGFPEELGDFFAAWDKRTLNVANDICNQIERSYAYRVPWPTPSTGNVSAMAWGHCHPLRRAQYLIAAHGITKNYKYVRAASLANDFHNGCNPSGSTLTSGLGTVYPVTFLDLPSYVDGIAEYVPGITPYRWTYGMPAKAVAKVFGGNKSFATRWPIWRDKAKSQR